MTTSLPTLRRSSHHSNNETESPRPPNSNSRERLLSLCESERSQTPVRLSLVGVPPPAPRPPLLHGLQRGQRPHRLRPDGAADRLRPRPAGARPEGVLRAARVAG